MKILGTLAELAFPSRCVSCSQLGKSLCQKCSTHWRYQRYIYEIRKEEKVRTISSIAYSDIAQKVILAAKERRLRAADLLVAEAISHSIREWLKDEWIDALIPIPSRKSAVRTRGRKFIDEITEEVIKGTHLKVAPLLRHNRKVEDQSRLNQVERWNNLEGAFVLEGSQRGGQIPSQKLVGRALLVDDLITTGATLHEAARTLRYAGIEVVGAVTAAITQTVR